MLKRSCVLLTVITMVMQVAVVRCEERPKATVSLEAQVHSLKQHEREQAAEIELLRQRLTSFELTQNGQAVLRRAQEEGVEGEEGLEGAEGKSEKEAAGGEVEERSEGEEGGEEELTEEEREEEEEEELADPVDLTLAISLLGYVTMIMTLFGLVNYEDQDMKIYVWGVLSNTLSIFLAVMMFTTLNGICYHFVPEGSPVWWKIVVDFAQLVFCFSLMQLSVAWISGSFERVPFEDTQPSTIEAQKAQRERRFKSVATLLAHMSGFAAINFGGGLQHLDALLAWPPLTFTIPPLLFVGQIVACRLVRKLRTHGIKQILASHGRTSAGSDSYSVMAPSPSGAESQAHEDFERAGIEWCVDKWDEETYESENEISGIAISFLLMQAIRYNLTGIMPNSIGIEQEHWKHPQQDVYALAGFGVLLAVLCCCIVVVSTDAFPKEITPGTLMSLMKRVAIVCQSTTAMGFAWALMYTSKWEITLLLPGLNPNSVTARVLLALAISMFAFFIILGLDYIADMKSTGEKTDRAIIAIITSLSILVGFTWEQSFDGAVEILAESKFKQHPVMAEMTLTACILVIVYPQWRKHILRTLLRLQKEKADSEAAE